MEILKSLDEYVPTAISTESIVKMQLERPVKGVEDKITEWKKETVNARFLHGAMGLCTETGELEEALYESRSHQIDDINVVEECGDVIWYLAIVVDSLNLKFADIPFKDSPGLNLEDAISHMIQSSDQILDKAKRNTFYGKELEIDKVIHQLSVLIYGLSYACDIEVAIDKVTRKLTGKGGRYEDGFTQKEAYDRDTDKERSILEQ